jgi:hypothetical protein
MQQNGSDSYVTTDDSELAVVKHKRKGVDD